jgi:cell division protein FtsB
MNQPAQDEFEEVESPFATKAPETVSPARERLRTRKNVFNRPFATDSTNAPTYYEPAATRRAIGTADNTELIERRKSALHETQIEYLEDEAPEEEEEEVEKRPSRSPSTVAKKKNKPRKNVLAKISWAAVGVLVLRLIFMDRGVWDYFSTEEEIREKRDELRSIQIENREIQTEVTRIQLDRNYQKQLAKEHLGVIAADEFLILFAGETPEPSVPDTTL